MLNHLNIENTQKAIIKPLSKRKEIHAIVSNMWRHKFFKNFSIII